MTLRQTIKKVLKESKKTEFLEKLKTLREKIGPVKLRQILGGLDEYVKLLHKGDYYDFFNKEIINKFDEYLVYSVNNFYGYPCEYNDEYQFIEVVKYAIIERMYYDYFGDLDDNGKEWKKMFEVMEDHIIGNWGEKLFEYYHIRCGN